MSKTDKSIAKQLIDQGRVIEQNWSQVNPDHPLVLEFLTVYASLEKSDNLSLKRMAEDSKKIRDSWELRHFLNFLIPLERFLQLKITDSEILIREGDAASKENPIQKIPLILCAENWRSAFNIGSLFRQAECIGAEEILLIGYSPTPENMQVQKTAMGCDQLVPWKCFSNSKEAFDYLKEKNFSVIAIETVEPSLTIFEGQWPQNVAFIFGNERFGVLPETLRLCDQIRAIPVYGAKNSLNVATSAALCGYAFREALISNQSSSLKTNNSGSGQ